MKAKRATEITLAGPTTILVTLLSGVGLALAFVFIGVAALAYFIIAWPFYLLRAIVRRIG